MLHGKILVLATLIAGPVFANSDAVDIIKECHEINDVDTRLSCYDRVTGYVTEAIDQATDSGSISSEASNANNSGSQWHIEIETSALTGKKDVFMSIPSQNTEPNNIGTPEAGRLWIRCMDNTTALLITHGIYVSDAHNVRYKLDDGPIQKKWMNTLNGGGGVGLFSGKSSIPFVKSMFDKNKMVAVLSGYSRNAELVFDISGLRNRIDELASACNWKP